MPFDSLSSVNESPVASQTAVLGASVREARRSIRLSQRALAELSGIDIATLQGLERGKGTVQPLLKLLNVMRHRFVDHDQPGDLGRWIAARRKAAGFSQEALAARIGMSKPTVIQIERGRGNIQSLLRVFDALVSTPTVVPQSAGEWRKTEIARPNFVIFEGDNLAHLKTLPDCSVHSVVTDPPYGIDYMAKDWDGSVPDVELWKEVIRVLKPGGFLLSFGATRTYHRMVVAIEQAGFEIRDQISWLHGQGMPKSRDVSKDIDRIQGAQREVVGRVMMPGYQKTAAVHGVQTVNVTEYDRLINVPITADAVKFHGYGTALKPAQEPIVLAQKPFSKRQAIAKNLLRHGVGALNIDACRVGTDGGTARSHQAPYGQAGPNKCWRSGHDVSELDVGRFPANVIHDGSAEVLSSFPNDTARYFYCPKPSAKERADNEHPTIKPVALMSYLVKLVTPTGGTVLDPFAGSGSTGVAALSLGFNAILMERDADFVSIMTRRLKQAGATVS